MPEILSDSARRVLLILYRLYQDAQEGARRGGCKRWRLLRQLDQDARASGSHLRRPLAKACAVAVAWKLLPPGSAVCSVLFGAHLRLSEPEHVTVTDHAAVVNRPV